LCPDGKLDSVKEAFRQFGENKMILGFSIMLVISIACFNSFGCSVTKYASSAQRATIDVARTVIIWIVFLLIPSSGEKFYYVQLIGFIIVVFGTLLYNEILVIPWLGFNNNLRKNETPNTEKLLDNEGEDTDDEGIKKDSSSITRKKKEMEASDYFYSVASSKF
jgi:hypothetical protein